MSGPPGIPPDRRGRAPLRPPDRRARRPPRSPGPGPPPAARHADAPTGSAPAAFPRERDRARAAKRRGHPAPRCARAAAAAVTSEATGFLAPVRAGALGAGVSGGRSTGRSTGLSAPAASTGAGGDRRGRTNFDRGGGSAPRASSVSLGRDPPLRDHGAGRPRHEGDRAGDGELQRQRPQATRRRRRRAPDRPPHARPRVGKHDRRRRFLQQLHGAPEQRIAGHPTFALHDVAQPLHPPLALRLALLGEQLPELLAGEVQARPDRPQRNVLNLRDLFARIALDLEQDERRSQLLAHPRHQRLHDPPVLVLLVPRRRARRGQVGAGDVEFTPADRQVLEPGRRR